MRVRFHPNVSRKTKAAPEEDIEGDDPLEFSMENEEPDEFYELPPSTLLDPAKVQDQSDEYEKIKQNGEILNQTFPKFWRRCHGGEGKFRSFCDEI